MASSDSSIRKDPQPVETYAERIDRLGGQFATTFNPAMRSLLSSLPEDEFAKSSLRQSDHQVSTAGITAKNDDLSDRVIGSAAIINHGECDHILGLLLWKYVLDMHPLCLGAIAEIP